MIAQAAAKEMSHLQDQLNRQDKLLKEYEAKFENITKSASPKKVQSNSVALMHPDQNKEENVSFDQRLNFATKEQYIRELKARNLLLIKINQITDSKLKTNSSNVSTFSDLKHVVLQKIEAMGNLQDVVKHVSHTSEQYALKCRDLDSRLHAAVEMLHHYKLQKPEPTVIESTLQTQLNDTRRSLEQERLVANGKIESLKQENAKLEADLKTTITKLATMTYKPAQREIEVKKASQKPKMNRLADPNYIILQDKFHSVKLLASHILT